MVSRSPPSSTARARFRLRHGADEIDLSGELVIGREEDCGLVLKGGLVSRHHARLRLTEDGLVLDDLGSLNGVFVNQRRIREPTLLAHGDVVAVGIDTLEVVDLQVLRRPAKPTQPLPVPFAAADVDGPEAVTVTTQLHVLTDRERQVFELIVLGHTQREIGDKLHLSVKTIETHRAHIADKLNCRTRAELVAYAITSGILRKL